MRGIPRLVRAIVGLIGLALIVSLVWGWWGDYRAEDAGTVTPGEESTATVEPQDEGEGDSGEAPPSGPDETAEEPAGDQRVVVVLIEGLNFRNQPSRDGELIRGLGRGTRLVLIETADGWHHVRDEGGIEGYVSASEQYTEVQ